MDIPSGKFRWNFMGNHPVDGRLRQPNDVDELPLIGLDALLRDGVLTRLPDDAPEEEAARPEPSRIVGVNISERELAEKDTAEAEAAGIAPSAAKGRTSRSAS